MFAIVLLGLLACARAVPTHSYHRQHGFHSHYRNKNNTEFMDSDKFKSNVSSIENAFPGHHGHDFHHHHGPSHFEHHLDRDNKSNRNCSCDLSKEIKTNDDLSKQFINNEPSIENDGKEYKITLKLQGFDKKELNVTAKKGQLAVQATRKVGCVPVINYFYIRTLPDNVGENMTWTYENGLLKMVLSITQVKTQTPTKTTDYPPNLEPMKNNTDSDFEIDVRTGKL